MPTWKDVEDYAAEKGITIQDAAQNLGFKLQQAAQPAQDALQKMASQAWDGPQKSGPLPGPPPAADRNDATLANQADYNQQLSDKLKNIGSAEQAHQQWLDDNNNDVADGGYTKYAEGGNVTDKFSHIKEMMNKHKKAGSELEASKNPQKFMEKMKNPSIKGLRRVAFNKGGSVKK